MKQPKSKKQLLHNYAWYSSIAIQMLVVILLSVYAGYKLDRLTALGIPLFTLVFSAGGVALAIFLVTKDIMRRKE